MNSEYTTDPRKQCIHNPLWIVLGAGMAFAAWALVALIPSYQRSACIHRIWKLGGYVQTASKLPPFEHRFPGVAHGWLGSKVERAVRLVRLAGTEAEDADLKALCRLSTQRTLDLRDTQVTDTGLRYLQALRELRVLILTGTSVRDEGVLQLGPLKQLEVLCLEETGVTDRAISQLKQLPNLEWLSRICIWKIFVTKLRKPFRT